MGVHQQSNGLKWFMMKDVLFEKLELLSLLLYWLLNYFTVKLIAVTVLTQVFFLGNKRRFTVTLNTFLSDIFITYQHFIYALMLNRLI